MSERPLFLPLAEARPHRLNNFSGIKFFDGTAIPDKNFLLPIISQITPNQLREEKKVWRPEETIEAGQIFFNEFKINVVGSPQSGKGTILFGLSEMCDIAGVGYVFIDGHHQEVPGEEIVETLKKANEKKIPIFYDSFDYLYLRSRGAGRDISSETQKTRVPMIMHYLDVVDVPVAITSHDNEWAQAFLNLDMRSQYENILSKFPIYEIPLELASAESVLRFLKDHDIPPAIADHYIELIGKLDFAKDLEEKFGFSKSTVILSSLLSYPVLKELVRDRRTNFAGVMQLSGEEFTEKFGILISEISSKCDKLTEIRRARKSKSNQ